MDYLFARPATAWSAAARYSVVWRLPASAKKTDVAEYLGCSATSVYFLAKPSASPRFSLSSHPTNSIRRPAELRFRTTPHQTLVTIPRTPGETSGAKQQRSPAIWRADKVR